MMNKIIPVPLPLDTSPTADIAEAPPLINFLKPIPPFCELLYMKCSTKEPNMYSNSITKKIFLRYKVYRRNIFFVIKFIEENISSL